MAMLSLLLALALPSADSVTMCVSDALTRAPIVGAQVAVLDPRRGLGPWRILPDACARVPLATLLATLQVRRVGYRQRTVDIAVTADTAAPHDMVVAVSLWPVSQRLPVADAPDREAQLLRTQRVRATADTPGASRLVVSMNVEAARAQGIGTTSGLLAALPFASLRSARGETGVSLRGARREQVAITLDGMPLSDPATGLADVSDLPLVALGSASVVLGADPLGTGPGASGGVVALNSAAQRSASARVGAFGEQQIEGAWRTIGAGALWHASASHRRSDNDFDFENDAGASGVRSRETRVNNDEQRSTVAVGAAAANVQITALASTGERGMVGAANVRAYDADRSRTTRLLVRGQLTRDRVQAVSGVRIFSLAYRDPTHPLLDATARAIAGDAEMRGGWRALDLRAGVGGDGVRASGGIEQSRGRAFAVANYDRRASGGSVDVGARLDAIGTYGALPSFSLAVERVARTGGMRDADLTVGARIAQAVRVPTLYDLYFSSPQRLFVRTLRPERVLLDAELQARAESATGIGRLSVQASVVSRQTRDAIVWFPGNFGWSPANVGGERLSGAEARVRLRPRWGELSAWGTYYDAVLTSGALRIPTPYVSRVAGGGQLLAHLRSVHVSTLLRVMGPRPYTAGPRNAAFELPTVALCDVSLSHRLTLPAAEMLVSLSLENATDARWQSVRGFPMPGRGWAISTTLRPLR